MGAWTGGGADTVDGLGTAHGPKKVRIEPFVFDLASRCFCSYPALQAFELRCVTKFFSPAVPTRTSVPQFGHSNVLSELNSLAAVLYPSRQSYASPE